MSGQRRDLGLDLLGLPQVVGVQEGDEVAGGGGDARVARGGHAGVLPAHVAQARVAPAADALRGVVGGPVVDDDDFEAVVGLREGAVDRLAHRAGTVVGGDHDGYLHGGAPPTIDRHHRQVLASLVPRCPPVVNGRPDEETRHDAGGRLQPDGQTER